GGFTAMPLPPLAGVVTAVRVGRQRRRRYDQRRRSRRCVHGGTRALGRVLPLCILSLRKLFLLPLRPCRTLFKLEHAQHDQIKGPASSVGDDVPLVEQRRDAEDQEHRRSLDAMDKQVRVHSAPPEGGGAGGGGGGGTPRVRR